MIVYDDFVPFSVVPWFDWLHQFVTFQVHENLRERQYGKGKEPLDQNSATHLLRHALGGCCGSISSQYRRVTEMLRLPKEIARSYRDDITIIVVHFNQNYLENLQIDAHGQAWDRHTYHLHIIKFLTECISYEGFLRLRRNRRRTNKIWQCGLTASKFQSPWWYVCLDFVHSISLLFLDAPDSILGNKSWNRWLDITVYAFEKCSDIIYIRTRADRCPK